MKCSHALEEGMILSRSRLGREVMRLALAAVLFLSAIAGARMQGEMAALALAFGSHGAALCSGAPAPVTGEDQDRAPSADHCQNCLAPVLGPGVAPAAAEPARTHVAVAFTDVADVLRSDPVIFYGARGPPQAA